jgi:trk system potassium uptake protein TrkA
MRVVFIGASSLAVLTAKLMRERGDEVVIIEHDKDHIDALTEELDCGFLHGDGSKPAILREELEHICKELGLEDIIVPSRTIGRFLAERYGTKEK